MADQLTRFLAAIADRYRIERPLGEGGMATVYLAEDLKHRRKVAVKVLRPELTAELGPERFLREIEVTANLRHPHILPLHDSGAVEDFLYYVMPQVEGESLRERLDREHQLPIDDALAITREVADALSHAHGRGIVHRDVKPENVFLEAGHAVIADFGIAAVTHAGQDRITQTGMSLGTPHYMSPEQAFGEGNIDGRSDLYSLACMTYEMLAGEPPFTGNTTQAVIAKRLVETAPLVSTLRDTVPAHVGAAISRALARAPADRFSSASDFADALTPMTTATSGDAAPLPLPTKRPRPGAIWRWVTAGAAAAVLVTAVWVARGEVDGPVGTLEAGVPALAVFPFTVGGTPDVAYLREGMTTLLSRSLDVMEDVRIVDPGTVIRSIGVDAGGDVIDAATALSRATEMGARYFVLGDVTESAGELRLHASLYDTSAPGIPVADADAAGSVSELFNLVQRLSADLLLSQFGPTSNRVVSAAARTTESPAALRAFLLAEQAMRASMYDSAIVRLQRAVAEDPTFALAYFRMAFAAGLLETDGQLAPLAGMVPNALPRALALADHLGERDRNLLDAYAAFRRGDADLAEEGVRRELRDHPDDLEARFLLAQVRMRHNPARGRPALEAKEHFEYVLSRDPDFVCPI